MDTCIIEISRENCSSGRSVNIGVALDGAKVGSLKNGEELQIAAGPGQHELSFYRRGEIDNTVSFVISEGQSRALFTVKMNRSGHIEVVNGLKTKQQKKKSHGCLISILCVIAAIILIGVIASTAGNSDSGPKKVGDQSENTSSAEPSSETQQSVFAVGDKVELDGVVVTLLSVTESSGGNYMAPDSGNTFVICEFEIENNSNDEIAISSLLSFTAYVDDYSTDLSLSAILSTNMSQLDGTISSGKKMHGVVGYEVSEDWEEIEVRFEPSLLGREIVFQYKK